MRRQSRQTSKVKRTFVKTTEDDAPDDTRGQGWSDKTIVLCLLMEADDDSALTSKPFKVQMSDGELSKLRLSPFAINRTTAEMDARHVRTAILNMEKANCRFTLKELPCYVIIWWIDDTYGTPDYRSLYEAIDRALRKESTEGLRGRFKAHVVSVEHFGNTAVSVPEPLRGNLCSTKSCETILVEMDKFAQKKKVEKVGKVDSAMRLLEKEASERPEDDLSKAILIVTDEVRHLRSIVESPDLAVTGRASATVRTEPLNIEQNVSLHSKSVPLPKEPVSLEDQKLINEAKQFLVRLEKQQSRKSNVPTPEESLAQVRQWFAEKEGEHFETLAGQREFAQIGNRIVKSIGCGFVCPCSKEHMVFVNLTAGAVGNSTHSFMMAHKVDGKPRRHLTSINLPRVRIEFALPEYIVESLKRQVLQ